MLVMSRSSRLRNSASQSLLSLICRLYSSPAFIRLPAPETAE